jgi:hypothetical protein
MAKINWNPEAKFIWSTVTLSDFVESRGSATDIPKIIEKLKENFSDAGVFAIIYNENPASSTAIIKMSFPENLQKIQLSLGGIIEKDFLKLTFEKRDLTAAGKDLEGKIKDSL